MHATTTLARALAVGGTLGLTTPVRAEGFAFSGGVSLVVWLGEAEPRGGLTFDLRGSSLWTTSDGVAGLGVFGQSTWLFNGSGRLALGLHGGQELSTDGAAWDLEVGWNYRTAGQAPDPRLPAGHGVLLGVLGHGLLVELTGRVSVIFVDEGPSTEGSLGFGLRYPGPFGALFGGGDGVSGRPLRVAGTVVRPAARVHASSVPTTEPIHQAIGRAWLEDMRDEAASVPAFAILAHDLTAVGAPTRLIEGARAARRDEIHHTRVCGELAARHLGVDVRPEPLRADRPERPSLERLVIESWRDGCLGEGAAARRAACAAERATDDTTRRVQGRIAHDEARHAELAWAVLAFALDAAPKTRDLLAAELAATPTSPRATHHPDDRAWIAQGRLGPADLDDTWHANHVDALRRAHRLIDHT